jgi:DNA processing protein
MERVSLSVGLEFEKFPTEVWCEGNSALLNGKLACIVGSREVSKQGIRRAREVSSLLGQYGYTLVSGLALGVDTIVHETALAGGYPTIAVLPTPIEKIYPLENSKLAHEIVKGGGLLVSEYESGTKTQKWHFLARNRLMVGLCEFVVIVEAQPKSGTTYSASCAAELGRGIYVFPGSEGANLLISEGADSVLELYGRLALMS